MNVKIALCMIAILIIITGGAGLLNSIATAPPNAPPAPLNDHFNPVSDTKSTSTPVQVASLSNHTSVRDIGSADSATYAFPGQQTLAFQDGVAPGASYAGTTDVILASDFVTINLGGTENLETFFTDTEVRRSLMRWDLSALPGGVTVSGATVELYRYDGDAANPMQVELYRVTRDWTEGTGSNIYPGPGYIADGATWLTATTGVAWTAPGGDYNITLVDQTTIPTNTGNVWIHLNATAAVQAWVEGGQPNHGLLLRPLNGNDTYHYYHSRETVTSTLRPRLVVTYTTGAPAPSLDITAPDVSTSWPVSSTQQIRWNTTGVVTQVNLAYAIGGVTATIETNVDNTGVYTWTTPPTPTTSARVRVESVVSPTTVYDVSGDFTLSATSPPTATIYLPLVLRNYTPPVSLDVTLAVNNPLDTARNDEPVTAGVPIPRNMALTNLSSLRLLDGTGQPVAAQFTPLARWGGAPDDVSRPVRWLLLDFQANVPASSTASYQLVETGDTVPIFPTLNVTDDTNAVTINTGVAQFSISKTDGRLTAPNLSAPLYGRARSNSTDYTTTGPVTVTVALSGTMRVSVHVQGAYRDTSGVPLLDYTSRYWFYVGQPIVRLFHTVENNTLCPLDEYGQITCFDIGSGGSVTVTDVSLVLPTDLGGSLSYQAAGETTPASGSLTNDLLLYQDSSGTDHWDAFPTWTSWTTRTLDTRPRMQAYVSFRGYSTTLGTTVVDSGDQAAGWLSLTGSSGSWTVGVRDFWQNFPKSLRAASSDGTIEIGLFPDEFGPSDYGFNLRAGEHKTHEIWLSSLSSSPLPLSPLFAQAPAQWYVESGTLGLTALVNSIDWPDHENYINHQLDTAPTYENWMDWYPNLPTAIETTDFYGMFDYGDWPIDYEGYGIAPLNLKYDANLGMWLQWARGGDARWFSMAEAADRHIADIDILHNLHSPRHWGDGIGFGHSAHDESGFTNPHRNSNSGSPDTTYGMVGMLLSYYLTGYEKAYEAAIEMADCIEYRLHNEYQLCSYFPDCSGEGYALMVDGLYEGNGRPAANTLNIAVAAYRATADPRYLAVADALVDWAKASDQPYIGGPTGQTLQMRPWMLNMYLRALAGYIETRSEFDLSDTYDAEGSFLAYADWLHTYPWLNLTAIETGPRAAYPYQWWFDGRIGIPGEDNDNDDPAINNWLLVGADAMAYAHRLSGNANYLEWGTRLFRAGSRDPWFEGDANTYAQCKETANSTTFGHIFLHQWAER